MNLIDPDGEFIQAFGGFIVGVVADVAIQTTVGGKSFGEVNLVSAIGAGVVGATGFGAITKGSQAIRAVRGARSVNKRLPKARRHAQSRRRRGKDSGFADRKVTRLEQEVTEQVTEAVAATGTASLAAAGKAATTGAFPEATVDNLMKGVTDVMSTGDSTDSDQETSLIREGFACFSSVQDCD